MDSRSRAYPAKVLVFGEYLLLQGARALALPYPVYSGRWILTRAAGLRADSTGPAVAGGSRSGPGPEAGTTAPMSIAQASSGAFPLPDPDAEALIALAAYLGEHPTLRRELDVEAFEAELAAGLRFRSTIPRGSGLGSSGALCAAVYDRFAKNPPAVENIREPGVLRTLRDLFAEMESHFHGRSSGLDPLVSFVDAAVLVEPDGLRVPETSSFESPSAGDGTMTAMLYDTGIPRSTGPLVRGFLEQVKTPEFAPALTALRAASDAALASWMEGRNDDFKRTLRQLSTLQLKHMAPMIPTAVMPHWQRGLDSGAWIMKLCGAGGGGFLLCFSDAPEKTAAELGAGRLRRLQSL